VPTDGLNISDQYILVLQPDCVIIRARDVNLEIDVSQTEPSSAQEWNLKKRKLLGIKKVEKQHCDI
jgi:hypothetical protein